MTKSKMTPAAAERIIRATNEPVAAARLQSAAERNSRKK